MSRCSRCLERVAAAIGGLALAGCMIHSGTVVLLPEREGRDAAITVRQGDASVVLDRPYAAANATLLGPRTYEMSAEDVQARFGSALAAQPAAPLRFTVYFGEQAEELNDESKAALPAIAADIGRTSAPDIVIVGHTDLVGSDAFNDALSKRRAESVRIALESRGVTAASIVTIGRGKREPAIPTAEGVAEARNRRVEILVR
jgi:outer membrane protein OmpA-like peptidoglycan-associated protein